MMKRLWIHQVYIYICSVYLKNKKNSIDNLERILLLMQLESIEVFDKPLFRYKIYVGNDNIKIPYMSDLLRISPIIDFSTKESFFYYYIVDEESKYITMFSKYKKLQENELIERIKEKTDLGLDNKYFVYGKYKNKNLRRIARLKIKNQTKSLIKTWTRQLLGIFSIGLIVGPIIAYQRLMEFSREFDTKPLETVIVSGLLLGAVWILWTWRWMKPTKYELLQEENKEN